MIVLADNDVIMKLAAFRLLEAAITVLERRFNVGRSDIFVLESLKGQLVRAVAGKHKEFRKYGVPACQHASEVLAELTSLTDIDLDRDEIQHLTHEYIQSGEVVLFGATRSLDNFCLVTGDKRALRALSELNQTRPPARPIYNRLQGRVLCLERIILLLIEELGFEMVRSAVVPQLACDQVLRIAFSSGISSRQDSVSQALDAYLVDLEQGNPNGDGTDSVGVGTRWLWTPAT